MSLFLFYFKGNDLEEIDECNDVFYRVNQVQHANLARRKGNTLP